jgi:hypothetical protein
MCDIEDISELAQGNELLVADSERRGTCFLMAECVNKQVLGGVQGGIGGRQFWPGENVGENSTVSHIRFALGLEMEMVWQR